jgi:hypothetical protein
MNKYALKIWPKTSILFGVLVLFFFTFLNEVKCQQVKWAKVYPLPRTDKIQCVIRDNQFVYAAGSTRRNAPGNSQFKVLIYKFNQENGDTLFVKDLGFSGVPYSMALDQAGRIRFNCEIKSQPWDYPASLVLNSEGEILKKDTLRGIPTACTMGNDGSLVVAGYRGRTGFPGQICMYFQRVGPNGQVDPWVELPFSSFENRADRIEQLPNGNYFISGSSGKRIISCEVDSLGGNPVYHTWYQSPDSSNIWKGNVGRLGVKDWMVGGEGGPSFVGVYDSTRNKIWVKKEVGALAPPLAMKDTSVVFGYRSPTPPHNFFYRFGVDSSLKWYFNMRDSLTSKGLPGAVDVLSYTFFEDESAIFAGTYNQDIGAPTDTQDDPIFMRIANVGTPVSVLSKPKSGPLKNETLAPWPNPTGGTLYLKQHFDKAEIHLYTLSGKEMGGYKIQFAQSIDISAFPKGIYLYRAVIDGKPYSGKIIKN